ncbi:transcription initiation factor TFIID subunit 3-like [Triplophysa dalaica]|uniref:transcription initiation factor TFIID subunit 3-like n=1 Tax=Triplophysa dalaica TaxID=1582913 RepID=UPI0024DFC347|nr:transcription initiation factor TFIID subunit 3-like [Triplophysa dalaica]
MTIHHGNSTKKATWRQKVLENDAHIPNHCSYSDFTNVLYIPGVIILQLNAEPECLAYCEESGDLLLGITGDLYRISYTQLHSQRNDKWDSDSDLPTSCIPTKSYKCRKDNCVAKKDSPERLKDTFMLDFGALTARHKDLESLRKGEVECRRRKPATVQTKQEAFNNYMRLMYMKRPDIKIPEEDMFDVNAELFPPKLPELCPLTPPSFSEGFFPNHRMAKRLHSSNKKTTQAPLGFIPNSVLVEQLWPDMKREKVIPHTNRWRLRLDTGCDGEERKPDEVQVLYNEEEEKEEEEPDMPSLTPITETPPEKENLHRPPPVVKKILYPVKPPKPLPPIKHPTPPPATPTPTPVSPSPTPMPSSPAPPSLPKQPTPPASSHLPEFLLQFVDEQWFQRMFPDPSCISSSLNPKAFCLHVLDFMIRSSTAQKQKDC